ncbi:MAG TPA: cupredoxin domain-containing protein [Anaeromyxobacteraceae bacterium]|nr:cupredoxin domain-containing protein [Anaeromyxobacteraceae bacterium]
MDLTKWLVVFGGAAAIAGVNWYFFLAGRKDTALARVGATGLQQVVIRVEGGFAPAHVRLHAGQPVRLVFDRRETSSFSEEVLIPEFGIRRFLPAHQRTSIDLPAARPGTYGFTCGLGQQRGTLVVEEA